MSSGLCIDPMDKCTRRPHIEKGTQTELGALHFQNLRELFFLALANCFFFLAFFALGDALDFLAR